MKLLEVISSIQSIQIILFFAIDPLHLNDDNSYLTKCWCQKAVKVNYHSDRELAEIEA